MRRTILILIVLVLAFAGGLLWWRSRPLPVLTVTTWPGAYGRAQAAAQMQPYGAANHIDVRIAQWEGDLDELRRAVKSGVYKGDVIDFELPAAIQACHEGLLEKIDPATLPMGASSDPAPRDFIKGGIGPCWVASVAYSQLVLFWSQAMPSNFGPFGLKEFFDLKFSPGGRGLHSGPKYNLELALLADGVAPADVYATLSTEAGLKRAFARLDAIKDRIVWWNASGEPAKLLRSGEVVMSTALSGDFAEAVQPNSTHRLPIWGLGDIRLYEMDVFGVPRGDPKKDMAMDFIRQATMSEPLATMANWVSLTPARRSALKLVDRNPVTHALVSPTLPESWQRPDAGFAVDDEWWWANDARIEARWRQWLAEPAVAKR